MASRERLKTLLLGVFCIRGSGEEWIDSRQMAFISEGDEVSANKSQIRVHFIVKTILISVKQYGNCWKSNGLKHNA